MKFLVAIHRPVGFDHAETLDESVRQNIDAVNDEMVAAGVRLFVGGLKSQASATSIRLGADQSTLVTDGPFLDAKEFVDGFWVLECASQDEAVEWGRKAALACRGSVEVRASCADGLYRLEVEDTGPGIDSGTPPAA